MNYEYGTLDPHLTTTCAYSRYSTHINDQMPWVSESHLHAIGSTDSSSISNYYAHKTWHVWL